MLGTTLPTPLYPIYQHRLGFSELMITIIYAIYAIGVIAALVVAGSWSDQIGRRRMLLGGIGLSAASALAFLVVGGLVALLIGRLISGLSAGIFTGTASFALLIASAVVAGFGQGLGFRAGLAAVTAASPADRRGEVASAFFTVLYVAISIPVIGVGLMTTLIGLRIAGIASPRAFSCWRSRHC